MDLQLGTRGANDPSFIFGDIGGVQAASDGTIFVLDYQAIEVRVFSPDGEFLRTIVRQGEGPGEVREANGIVLVGDTLLWVNDHGQWAVVGADADDEEELVDEETGPYEGSFRVYYKSYDLSTEEVDSVYMGESTYRGYASVTELGSSYYGLPFAVSNVAVVNPSGGFWSTNTGSYSLARRNEGGDTLMVIEATLPRVPVTSEDRSSYVQGIVERRPEELRAAEAVAALMPDFKPVLDDIFTDDEGRLWVKRAVPADTPPFFDLFSDDGDYLGSIRLTFTPAPYRPVWVQHGNIYAVIEDELDVPYLVRGAVGS